MTERYHYIRDGAAIYARSFAIIRAESDLSRFTTEEARIAVRMIHGSGMVEIAGGIRFGGGVTLGHGVDIAAVLVGDLDRHGIVEAQLLRRGSDAAIGDGAGMAALSRLGEIGQHRHRAQDAGGFQRQQFRVARPHAEREQSAEG
jgi:hypothetical protein